MKFALFTVFVVAFAAAFVAVGANAAAIRTKKAAPFTSTGDVKLLWKKTVGSFVNNEPYYNASKDWLYVNGGTELAILHGSTGAKMKSVSISFGDGESAIVPGDNGKIYYSAADTMFCRDAQTLDIVWNYSTQPYFSYTPLYVASEKAVYVGQWMDPKTYKFDAETGEVLWSHTGNNGSVSPQMTYSPKHNLVFSGTEGSLDALHSKDGQPAWIFPTSSGVYTKPVLSDDENTVFFGTRNGGNLYSVDVATGKQNWKANFANASSAGLNLGTAPLFDKGTLYFPSYSSCHAVDAATGKVLWKYADCPSHEGDLAITRKYGDAMVFSLSGPPGGIQAVALNGSGTLWSWTGAYNTVSNIMTPQPDGKMFVGDNSGDVYALQVPPASSAAGTIVEKRCTDMACSQDCVSHRYQVTKCVQTSSSRSVKRQCLSNGNLLIQEFTESATCDQFTAHNDAEYTPGKCYGQNFGGSIEVVSCSV